MMDQLKAAANRKAREARKRAYLQQVFDRYSERFRATSDQSASALARKVHTTMDQVLERDRGADPTSKAIQCRRGCDHCCRVPVEIWPHEAALLVESARAAGIAIDQARLERQSRYSIDDWQRQPAEDRACIFLGDEGQCQVYDVRPNACRKLLVVSEPALCDSDQHAAQRVERWLSWEAEVLESAALEIFGTELMPRLLLAELRSGA
jgi:Fe-S-cluster containining protein